MRADVSAPGHQIFKISILYMDKLADELAKGKSMEKILGSSGTDLKQILATEWPHDQILGRVGLRLVGPAAM